MCYTKGTAIMTYLYYLFEISEVTVIFSVVYANFFVITEMNDESSRSHLVIGITLECTNKNTGNVTKGKVTTATFYNLFYCKINFCGALISIDFVDKLNHNFKRKQNINLTYLESQDYR